MSTTDELPGSAMGYGQDQPGAITLENIEAATNVNGWIAGLFKPYLGSLNLEIGAGCGTITQFLAGHYTVDLCELDGNNRKRLGDRFQEFSPRLFADYFSIASQENYSCIYSSNVLEHFADDLAVLAHASTLLKDQGYFAAYVPATPFLYASFDRSIGHFRRYGRREIAQLNQGLVARKIPLKMIKLAYYNPIGALGWLVRMKWMQKATITKGDVLLYDQLFPYLQWTNRFAGIFPQNALMVWQKGHVS